jgi:cyanophycinase
MGWVLLAGGAEFTGEMASADRRALTLAGGVSAVISIIPAAAAPDDNHINAGENGVRWFKSLGAAAVTALPLIDRSSADDAGIAKILRSSALVYMLGGFPRYLAQTLTGSAAWAAVLDALRQGAVLAGSSAGAMVLCSHCFDPYAGEVIDGLGLVPQSCFVPHYDRFGQRWAPRLARLLPAVTLIGVDEQTGILGDVGRGEWQVLGKGRATIHRGSKVESFLDGATMSLRL